MCDELLVVIARNNAKPIYERIRKYVNTVNQELMGLDKICLQTKKVHNDFNQFLGYSLITTVSKNEIIYASNKSILTRGTEEPIAQFNLAKEITGRILLSLAKNNSQIPVYYNGIHIKCT